jgi:hypothetical protein
MTKPDWNTWTQFGQVELWAAVALSCDVEPNDLARPRPQPRPDEKEGQLFFWVDDAHEPPEFDQRLLVAESHLGYALPFVKRVQNDSEDRFQFSTVRLKDLALLALRIITPPWTLPPEFPRMSQTEIEHRLRNPAGNVLLVPLAPGPEAEKAGPSAPTHAKPVTGTMVQLPHMTATLDGVFKVMRENWTKFDRKNPPKQNSIAEEIDKVLGWSAQADGFPSRRAQTLAAAIRPDHLAEADARRKIQRRRG